MGTCPSKPGKLNGSNVDNFVMANQGTPAKPKNIDSQPKENENPKPVEKEEKVQNGPTMVGGKRKHRKTQRKSKKRRTIHK